MRILIVLLAFAACEPAPRGSCVALTPQTVEVRFRERDGKQSSKLAAQGTVTRAENVTMSKPGAYARRTGSELVETVSGAEELTTYSGALVTLSDTALKHNLNGSFTAPASSSLRWTNVLATKSVENGNDQLAHQHVRAADGRDWHVWEDSEANVKYSVIEPSTGTRIVHDATVDSGASRPTIVAVGTDILIFYIEGAETVNNTVASLRVRKIEQSIPSSVGAENTVESGVIIPPGALPSLFFGSFPYDVQVNGSTPVIASVIDDGAGYETRVRTWNVSTMSSSGVVTENVGLATKGTDVIGFLNHDFADSNYYLGRAYVDNTTGFRTLILQVIPTNLASITNYTLKTESGDQGETPGWQNVTGYVDGSATAHLLAEVVNQVDADDNGTIGSAAVKWHYYATRTSGGSIAATTRAGLGIGSRPWIVGSDRYVLMTHTSYAQPTYFVADPSTGSIYGRIFPGSAGLVDNEKARFVSSPAGGSISQRRGRLPTPYVDGTLVTIAVAKLRQAPPFVIEDIYRGGVIRGAWTVSINIWGSGSEFQPVSAADELLIPGGAPRMFDGSTIVESGFHLFPEVPPSNDSSNLPVFGTGNEVDAWVSASGELTNGTYFIQLVWEWLDGRGRLHRSAPSIPFAMVVSGVTGFTIKVLKPLTARSGIRLVAYRTTVNAGVDASYFRAAEVASSSLSASGALYDEISILDADSVIDDNEQLYTDDGTLENAPAPSMRQVRPWKDRVMFLLEENRRAFGWSKLVKPDLGLEWSDSFVFEVADEYGEFTGLAPLGNNFVLFKRDAVYWLSGAGPDDTGNGQFSEVVRLEGHPGTTNGRTIVSTEMGVFFQAPDNVIWLLTPGLERIPIGEPCADIGLTVVAAIDVPDKRQVRFYTATTTLVYDLIHKVWTTFTGQAAVSATVLSGRAHYLTTGAAVRRDSTGYTEAGTTYQAVLELSWLSIAGLAGYQRVWSGDIVGEATGAYSLSAVLTADFGTNTVTKTVASSALTAAFGHRTRFHVPLSLQQKTSLRLKLQDDSPTTAGGLWEGINLQCGFAGGRRPQLPSAHRMG